MEYQLKPNYLPFCRASWDSESKSFLANSDREVMNCCLDSCRERIRFCFDTCYDTYNDKEGLNLCYNKCKELIKNCENVCNEINGVNGKLNIEGREKKFNERKHINICVPLLILVITLALIVLFLKIKN